MPAIVLSDTALALIRDVFERPGLLADSPPVERRVVAWGSAASPAAVPHAAVATSEDSLLDALGVDDAPGFDGAPDFIVQAGACRPDEQRRFGSRKAVAAEVRMRNAGDVSACWIEALDAGWLFLAPNPGGASWLIAVGAPPEDLLAQSRLIAGRIGMLTVGPGAFDVCPRIAMSLTGEDWLACGTAAIAFDPICGDGVAQAVREAVLAAAVIVAIRDGGDAAALLAHYELMLIAAVRRHLKLCAEFYDAMGPRPWWSAQLLRLVQGHRWCTAKLETAPEPRFVLRGFNLLPREAAA